MVIINYKSTKNITQNSRGAAACESLRPGGVLIDSDYITGRFQQIVPSIGSQLPNKRNKKPSAHEERPYNS